MRIEGRRSDGAQLVLLGAGLAVIMRGMQVSKAVDEDVVRKMGPWEPVNNTLELRRKIEKAVDQCRVVPLEILSLAIKPPEPPTMSAEELTKKAEEHQRAAWGEDNDIEALQKDADKQTKAALAMSGSAKTAEAHRKAAEALEQAAAAQEAVAKLLAPSAGLTPGTPEFDAYVSAEVERRVADHNAGSEKVAFETMPGA